MDALAGIQGQIRELEEKMDVRFDRLETKMDYGFGLLLPKEQWPPSEDNISRGSIERKLLYG